VSGNVPPPMHRLRLLSLLALFVGCTPTPTTSPPTDAHAQFEWTTWSPDSFSRAAAQDRLILINVVATWCHWCHVMDEVTFEDPEVAELLREHFVVIRVDSDARPDVSERYSDWGWPATAFLSPSAQPVLNLRGFQKPREFALLLRELIAEHERGQLRRFDENPYSAPPPDADLDRIRDKAIAQVDGYFDVEGLGWGAKQKYPWPDPIDLAFLRARVRGEQVWRERALATLEAERALIDPVWGGMFQYSLKGVWDQPHYEKIAAIQAGAIENYAHAAMITGDARWLEPARQNTTYLLGTMQDPQGGFHTSQDADLRLADGTSVLGKDYHALDDAGRRELGIPRIDTAVYADLNGLTIHALTELYRASGDQLVLDAAIRAADRILVDHRSESGGLSHGPNPGPTELRYLADQAAMGFGLLGLHRVTADPRWLTEASAIAQFMVDALADADGGLFAHTVDHSAVGVFAQRRKPLPDNALAAQFFIELHLLLDGDGTQPTPWLEHARRALLAVGGDAQIEDSGKLAARYAFALELLGGTKFDLTLVAEDGDPIGDALWTAALSVWEPRASLERSAPGVRYPDLGHAAVYMCSDRACSRPLRDPATAAQDLDAFALD
jgi:uncharacterized protein YyaL (SSP411 family)